MSRARVHECTLRDSLDRSTLPAAAGLGKPANGTKNVEAVSVYSARLKTPLTAGAIESKALSRFSFETDGQFTCGRQPEPRRAPSGQSTVPETVHTKTRQGISTSKLSDWSAIELKPHSRMARADLAQLARPSVAWRLPTTQRSLDPSFHSIITPGANNSRTITRIPHHLLKPHRDRQALSITIGRTSTC